MAELSRLGREQTETSKELASIVANNVRIFFYREDKELNYDSAVDKFMVNALIFAAEMERELASERGREKSEQKFNRGEVTGGRVYGYNNVWNFKDGAKKVAEVGAIKPTDVKHAEYEINEDHKTVILAIHKMYNDNHGMKAIAKTLNQDEKHKALNKKYFNGLRFNSPAYGTKKGINYWSPSTIRKILTNERYTGKIPWGQYRKGYKGGTKTRIKQAEVQYLAKPELRIIPQALWDKTQKRLTECQKKYIRSTDGKLWGNPGIRSNYLLTSLAKCSICGSNISVLGGKDKNSRKYGCSHHHNRGTEICANNHRASVPTMDERVITAIDEQVLNPEIVSYAVDLALHKLAERRKAEPKRPAIIERAKKAK
ncbi:MAG TPA: recombinase family protein [Gammaproteobacteria bacterium]|nr:recombinase family protein [Gammaproteobacteria bacterium]